MKEASRELLGPGENRGVPVDGSSFSAAILRRLPTGQASDPTGSTNGGSRWRVQLSPKDREHWCPQRKTFHTVGSAEKEALDADPETSSLNNGPIGDKEFL